MFGHVDVVDTAGQQWTRPPFEGVIEDGCVWGRGALDMKGAIAMMLSALIRLKREGSTPDGDIVLAVVCDEENGGTHGARYLVEQHPDLFTGVRHAISEIGGFPLPVGGVRFYPITVAEKQLCPLDVVFRGHGGHGSLPFRGGAMARLGEALRRLDSRRLPVRITPTVRTCLRAMARALPFPTSAVFRLLLSPLFTDAVLGALGQRGRFFDPLLHNTVNATIVRGGDKINVIPAEIRLGLDGRLLPGLAPEVLVAEVEGLLGSDAEVKLVEHQPSSADPDMGLFETLAECPQGRGSRRGPGTLRPRGGLRCPTLRHAGHPDLRVHPALPAIRHRLLDPAPRRGRARTRRGARVRGGHHPPAAQPVLSG